MKSVEDFLKQGSKVFRPRAADRHAIENYLQESDAKADGARNQKDRPGNRVDSAYDAIHLTCLACLSIDGYRTTAEHGHHQELLEAICSRIRGGQGLLDRIEAVMEARNKKYDGSGRSESDAVDAVKAMEEFLVLAEAWLKPRVKALYAKK